MSLIYDCLNGFNIIELFSAISQSSIHPQTKKDRPEGGLYHSLNPYTLGQAVGPDVVDCRLIVMSPLTPQ